MGAALFVGGQGLAFQCRGALRSTCTVCTEIDTSGVECLFGINESRQQSLPSKANNFRRSGAKGANDEPWREVRVQHLEELTQQLFQLHDLNGDGRLEESELITLNEQIAILHHGKDTDIAGVRAKYSELFRTKFDSKGQPVPYEIFQRYAAEVLDGVDNDPEAQEMILEQFVAEARSGREAFDLRLTDLVELGQDSTDDMAGDLTGCPTAAAASLRLAWPAETSAEEGCSCAEVGTGGGSTPGGAVGHFGGMICSEVTAVGDAPPLPHLATESSLEIDTALQESNSGAQGSLAVEHRSVLRATSRPAEEARRSAKFCHWELAPL